MPRQELRVRIDAGTAASSGGHAQALQEQLSRDLRDIQVTTTRTQDEATDFGTTLVLVLGTPVAIELARALHAYMTRTGIDVIIEEPDRTVRLKGLKSEDMAAAIEAAQKSAGR